MLYVQHQISTGQIIGIIIIIVALAVWLIYSLTLLEEAKQEIHLVKWANSNLKAENDSVRKNFTDIALENGKLKRVLEVKNRVDTEDDFDFVPFEKL